MRFPAYWDAELRAYEYLNDVLTTFPDWRTRLNNDVGTANGPANLTSPHTMAAGNLTSQIVEMLDRALDRPDRFPEILDQHSGEGAIGYFLGMLMIDPARMPATHLLIRVARRIGEHIAMCLKGEFRCPRPSQLCTAIVPMVDPPATPSFPSGHSLQAQLIAKCLLLATPPMRPLHLVTDLANRVGQNRIIAGLHYPQDHAVGQAVADWCLNRLLMLRFNAAGSIFDRLKRAATSELADRELDKPEP
jgi:membrane-associated phospholipid phosphatase